MLVLVQYFSCEDVESHVITLIQTELDAIQRQPSSANG